MQHPIWSRAIQDLPGPHSLSIASHIVIIAALSNIDTINIDRVVLNVVMSLASRGTSPYDDAEHGLVGGQAAAIHSSSSLPPQRPFMMTATPASSGEEARMASRLAGGQAPDQDVLHAWCLARMVPAPLQSVQCHVGRWRRRAGSREDWQGARKRRPPDERHAANTHPAG